MKHLSLLPFRNPILILLFSIFAFGLSLCTVGCGGSQYTVGSTDGENRGQGRATISIRWPEPSRLIPVAASSLRVEVRSNAGTIVGSQLLSRPPQGGTSSLVFDPLPIGNLTAQATAYPNSDGTGIAQAIAITPLVIQAGRTTSFRIAPVSTIDRINITPATLSLKVGATANLTAAATNTLGEVVLTQSSTLTWSSGNSSIVTVSTSGLVTGIAAGTATLTVTENESGKVATLLVTVEATPPPPATQMYVSSIANDSVKVYDVATGKFLRDFIPAGKGLVRPQAIVFGPNNRVYISSYDSKVTRFDTTTGAYIDDFVTSRSGGMDNSVGMLFGKDSHLLICSAWTSQVKKYNGQTGAYMGNFLSGNGLNLAHDIIYGPDGRLYVCSSESDEIKRYDPDMGAFLDNFVTAGSGGLDAPNHLVFGPDGNLYVTSWGTHEVKRYNGTTGAFLGTFVTARSGGLNMPFGLAFGPDGNLYVCSKGDNHIKKYQGQTGAYLGDIDSANTAKLSEPWGITFH